MAINPGGGLPHYPQYPPHKHFPGLDIDKGPVYRAGAILLGAWILVVLLCPVLALVLRDTWPLWPLTRWLAWMIFAGILSATLLFRFLWDRYKYGLRPRRFGIHRLEASREGNGPSTRKVTWDPYDRLPPLMMRWYLVWLYDVGDGVVEFLLKQLKLQRAPMVEEPPFFDAPQWPPVPPNLGPGGGPNPGPGPGFGPGLGPGPGFGPGAGPGPGGGGPGSGDGPGQGGLPRRF